MTPPFPFVVGVGRSGTTLLRSLLDAHPELAVVHESRFLAWMARDRARYEAANGFAVDGFLHDLLENPRGKPSRLYAWDLDPHGIRSAVTKGAPVDLADAVRLVYGAYAAAHGKPRYGDKTPGYLQHLEVIAGLLPEARFVHIVRDGRDVALSMLDVDFGGTSVVHAAWLWRARALRGHRAGAALGPERYLLVRYEDLVDESERELRRICAFLSLPFDPCMVRYADREELVFQGLRDQAHHEHLRLPVTKGLRDWRTAMVGADVARFERVAGDALQELGYGRVTDGRPRSRSDRVVTAALIAEGRARARLRSRRRRRDR